jgi:hypothetical protein
MDEQPLKPSETGTLTEADTSRVLIDERRMDPRFPFTATAEVVDLKSRTRMNARTSDLSRHGCYIDTQSPFPLHTKVRIRISSAKKSFDTHATVVYSLPNMGMGLAFGEPEPEQKKILSAWIDDLSGVSEADFDLSPARSDHPAAEAAPKNEQVIVLQDLLLTLMQRGVLTDVEGKAMLQKLLR